MRSLHLVGCAGNRISSVELLTVEDVIFQDMEASGTTLWLNKVATASIGRSRFGYLQEHGIVVGGVFYISSSSVSVHN